MREHAGVECSLSADYTFKQVFIEIVHGRLGNDFRIVGGLRLVFEQPVDLVSAELVIAVEGAYEGSAMPLHALFACRPFAGAAGDRTCMKGGVGGLPLLADHDA